MCTCAACTSLNSLSTNGEPRDQHPRSQDCMLPSHLPVALHLGGQSPLSLPSVWTYPFLYLNLTILILTLSLLQTYIIVPHIDYGQKTTPTFIVTMQAS